MQQRHLAQSTHSYYYHSVLSPTTLLIYKDVSVLELPFAALGTLINAITILVKNKQIFNPYQHESICVDISIQVLTQYAFICSHESPLHVSFTCC